MAAANVPMKAKEEKQPHASLNKCVLCVSAWNMPKLPLSPPRSAHIVACSPSMSGWSDDLLGSDPVMTSTVAAQELM